MFAIGPYKLTSRVVLAPMAGVTDLPFRELCREMGAGLAVTEMVSSNPNCRNTLKTRTRLDHRGESAPRSVQIVGGQADWLAAAAIYNVDRGADMIDINMGCPARKVCKKAAGSALLRDPALVRDILQSVVAAVDIPVTLKIRTGWDRQSINAPEIAKIAEDCGIEALSIHGRTRACRFSGSAEYETIARVVQSVDIPVIANGDISTPQQALNVLNQTGAAGVMIGRAAQGNPWIFRAVNALLNEDKEPARPSAEEIASVMRRHLQALHQFYGGSLGVRIARKHIGWYFTALDAESFRRHFNSLDSEQCQLLSLQTFTNKLTMGEIAA